MLENSPTYNKENANLSKLNLDDSNVYFPDTIYQNLPSFFIRACEVFKEPYEKDIFLLGSFGVLSSCLPNLFGKYDQKKYSPNLFFFVIAAASSGKGAMVWAKYLGKGIHNQKREEYQADLNQFQIDSQKRKGQSIIEEPKQKMLFIPANSSSSAFLQAISDNDGKGILFCTEADTLSASLSQDWGNYSDILRCAFHHETIDSLRRTNKEFFEVENPQLSIVLSGTPGQVSKLIPNSENGLFSRFGFYSFALKPKMKNVFASNNIDFDDHFKELGEEIKTFHEKLLVADNIIEFEFSEGQKIEFLSLFEEWHHEFHLVLGLNSIATVRRLGLIFFRIAMILSTIRLMEEKKMPLKIICGKNDFETARSIIGVLKIHAAKMFTSFSSKKDSMDMSFNQLTLYKILPDEFTRKEAVDLAAKLEPPISNPTVDRFLKGNYFEKPAYGKYSKTK